MHSSEFRRAETRNSRCVSF